MTKSRKITVEVPAELLEKAQEASGTGITQTVRTGLQLVAASRAYARLRQSRGKIRFSQSIGKLKSDRCDQGICVWLGSLARTICSALTV